MKCDELKDRWFNAYPEIMGIEGGEPTKCYGKADVDEAIAELKEERRWRKFPDEKPKEDTWCIVFHDGEIDSDHYTKFTYNKKCDFALYGNEVTHWIPLPSAPKEEN